MHTYVYIHTHTRTHPSRRTPLPRGLLVLFVFCSRYPDVTVQYRPTPLHWSGVMGVCLVRPIPLLKLSLLRLLDSNFPRNSLWT